MEHHSWRISIATVGVITHNAVTDVRHVHTQLVAAARFWEQQNLGDVLPHEGAVPYDLDLRLCILARVVWVADAHAEVLGAIGSGGAHGLLPWRRLIWRYWRGDQHTIGLDVAVAECQVLLTSLSTLEQRPGSTTRLAIQSHAQDTTRGVIKPVGKAEERSVLDTAHS